MIGKKPRPLIGKLIMGLVVTGNGARLMEVRTSPRTPLELKIQSPRGRLKSFDDVGGVGLGIVAALKKSGYVDVGGETPAKKALYDRNMNRSDPTPVNSTRRHVDYCNEMENESDSLEEYTYVTCHIPNKFCTKAYRDGGECSHRHEKSNNNGCVFYISPPLARFGDMSVPPPPASDFLSSCHLCKKKLHGRDIYMYRGEKAFCSTECRCTQIGMDEQHKQKCGSEASTSADVSVSPYTNGHMFSISTTGVLAI